MPNGLLDFAKFLGWGGLLGFCVAFYVLVQEGSHPFSHCSAGFSGDCKARIVAWFGEKDDIVLRAAVGIDDAVYAVLTVLVFAGMGHVITVLGSR